MTAQASYEDLLYIVLGLVWIAFSFYNAKKKKQAKNAPAPTGEKKSILESLIDEMGLQDEKTPPPVYESPQEINTVGDEIGERALPYEEPEKVFSYDDYYEESNYDHTINVIEKKRTTPIGKVTTVDNGTKKLSVKKKGAKINLRKAVIYSEILKSPYF